MITEANVIAAVKTLKYLTTPESGNLTRDNACVDVTNSNGYKVGELTAFYSDKWGHWFYNYHGHNCGGGIESGKDTYFDLCKHFVKTDHTPIKYLECSHGRTKARAWNTPQVRCEKDNVKRYAVIDNWKDKNILDTFYSEIIYL